MAPDAGKIRTTAGEATEIVSTFDKSENYIQKTTAEAKERVDTLKLSAINSKLSNAETKADINAARTEFTNNLNLNSLEWYLRACNELLQQIDYAIQATKNRQWLSKSWRKTMQNTRQKLQDYKKWVEAKKKALIKQTNPEIYPSDKQKLREYRANLESAKQDIAQWQRWELSNGASYLYNSPENAKSSNKAQEKMIQFEQKLQQEVKNWAILNIFEWNTYNTTNFYRRIAEWRYTSADYTTYITYSDILDPSFQRCWIRIPTEQGIISPATGTRTWRYVDYTNTSFQDTFKKWWIGWMLDKALSHCNNLTPWQRNTRKSIWVLAAYWAWIYGLFKFFTNKKMWFRKKTLITGGAFLWTEVLLWESPISLFNKFMSWWLSRDKIKNSFWNAVSSVRGSGVESSETIAPAMYSLMLFNPKTTIWNINTMTENFKSDNNLRKAFYDKSLDTLQHQYWWTQTAEYFRANFSENFNEQKRNNWLASFWVTDMSNPRNSNKLIYEFANNTTMNEIALERFKSENWVKETNDKNKKQEFRQYINTLKANNEAINTDVLQTHLYDWFIIDGKATYTERPEDFENRKKLTLQVENLSLSQENKDKLKLAIQNFYDKRNIDTKPRLSDFSLKMEGEKLVLKSHDWEEASIDIDKWELIWFWKWISFTDLSDLLNAADLSNKILNSQKWKIARDYPPFQYKWPTTILENWIGKKWRGIYFNDAASWNIFDFDTRILSGGWGWSIGKIDTLRNYPEEYASYLSDRRLKKNKIEFNNNYPLVKKLSENWIIFTDEKEVQQLEIRLNEIKEGKKFAIWDLNWKPFKISWKLKSLGKRLIFTGINWDKDVFSEDISNKFPTIIANKDEFLSFMNNRDNWMRWYEITQRLNS